MASSKNTQTKSVTVRKTPLKQLQKLVRQIRELN
jgi:hypothetical protein